MRRSAARLAVAALAVTACGGGTDESPGGQPLADPEVLLPPYETAALDAVARIEGTVTWDGPLPSPTSIVLADSVARVCRAPSLRVTPVRIVRGGVMESVVWVDGIRRGKALPASRRFDLATDRCRLTPASRSTTAVWRR